MIRDSLLRAFADRLAFAPDEPILVSTEGTATPATVEAIAAGIADDPAAAALEPGDAAAVAAENGAGFLGLLLGLRRRGATVVLFDRNATSAEIERACSRFPIRLVARCRTAWPRHPGDWSLRPVTGVPGKLERSVAVVKLTSGSTGEPRGAATPADALLADDEALRRSMGIGPEDRLLATVPFSHSYGLSSLVVPALARGMRLILPVGSDPFAPLRAARALGATVFPTVPAYLEGLLRTDTGPDALGGLRRVITAGARLQPETAARFRRRFGQPAHVFYGASECGGIAFDRSGEAGERGEVGEPIDGVRIDLEPTPDAAEPGTGRVAVRSPAVTAGYLPDPDPRLAGGRFVTDDLGRLDGGRLTLIGRLGNVINVRGKKVDPSEVEAVIARQPGVDEVRVLGFAGAGSAGESVHAFVACAPGAVTEEALRRWCVPRLTDFKVPRRFVLVERLPRNDRGKIDRRALERLRRPASRRP